MRQLVRKLALSPSPFACVVRVCAMVVLAQFALTVVRVPFTVNLGPKPRGPVDLDTDDDVIRWRNTTHVNTKALVSLLADTLSAIGQEAKEILDDYVKRDVMETDEGTAAIRDVSAAGFHRIRETLLSVLPEITVVMDGSVSPPKDRPVRPLALPKRYRTDVHQIILFDQWLPVLGLTLWISPLLDSRVALASYRVAESTLAAAISYHHRPHLSVITYPFTDELFWGVYERGNSINLNVGPPLKWRLPERFGVVVDTSAGPESRALARKAFFEDAEVFSDGSTISRLMSALACFADVALFSQPVPLRELCPVHVLFRMYGGRVTDASGQEVTYDADQVTEPGPTVAALFYHSRVLKMLQAALQGNRTETNITGQLKS